MSARISDTGMHSVVMKICHYVINHIEYLFPSFMDIRFGVEWGNLLNGTQAQPQRFKSMGIMDPKIKNPKGAMIPFLGKSIESIKNLRERHLERNQFR